MKKLVTVLGLMAVAQSAPAAAQQIGVKAGLSFGNITNKGLLPGSLKTRTGGAAGVSLGFGGGILGFGVEALYAQRGLHSDEALATSAVKVDHLDVPVYLKVSVPTPGIRPFAYAGPQVSFEVKCRRANGLGCGSDGNRTKTNYAGVIGAGVRFAGTVGVEARYLYGLSDLKLSTVTTGESYRHRSFMILISLGM